MVDAALLDGGEVGLHLRVQLSEVCFSLTDRLVCRADGQLIGGSRRRRTSLGLSQAAQIETVSLLGGSSLSNLSVRFGFDRRDLTIDLAVMSFVAEGFSVGRGTLLINLEVHLVGDILGVLR